MEDQNSAQGPDLLQLQTAQRAKPCDTPAKLGLNRYRLPQHCSYLFAFTEEVASYRIEKTQPAKSPNV